MSTLSKQNLITFFEWASLKAHYKRAGEGLKLFRHLFFEGVIKRHIRPLTFFFGVVDGDDLPVR